MCNNFVLSSPELEDELDRAIKAKTGLSQELEVKQVPDDIEQLRVI